MYHLVWEDLTVVVTRNSGKGAAKKLLNGLSGYAQSNRIMAIMGPSGSGKSTLLDALAGRLSSNIAMTGNVLLNGKKRSINCRDVAYVSQQDVFLGTLTVRETLTYAAHLRLPTTMTKQEIKEIIEETIVNMGLQECAENKIGNWHLRGISGGEKRRLSIGAEILTQTRVLCLDEPTSGLDSASSFFVSQVLRNIAHRGRIVVCSIHQPSIDVFNLFDDLFLLSGGDVVYFGEADTAIKFFSDSGFPCPKQRNPPEHFLRCVTTDFDNILATLKVTSKNHGLLTTSDNSMNMTTAEMKATLVKKFKSSTYWSNARNKIHKIKSNSDEYVNDSETSYPSWRKQLRILTHRSFLNMSRDLGYYWLRILFYIMVAVGAGTLNFNIGTSNQAIMGRGKCDGFLYGLMICLSIGGLSFFLEEIKVFNGERSGGLYGEAVYVLSNFLSSFPFIVTISFSSGSILYYMVNFHPGISHLLYFCVNLFCCIAVSETCVLVVGSLVSSPLLAMGAAAGVTVFNLMASNIFRPLSDLPKIFWRYPMSYISYAAWGMQGHFKNDMIGLEFDPAVPGNPKLKGEIILKMMIGIDTRISKWWDVGALLCLLITYRLLFFMALVYRKQVSSLLQEIYAKRILLQRTPLIPK